MIQDISKQVFLNFLQYPTLGWLTRAGETAGPVTLAERFRILEGIEVGRRVSQVYPGGVFISGPDLMLASEKTKRLMNDPNVSALFEGNFIVNK